MDPEVETEWRSLIYMRGDPAPFMTDLTPEAVITRVVDLQEAATTNDGVLPHFLQRNSSQGHTYIRPEHIVAISPCPEVSHDDDEDED